MSHDPTQLREKLDQLHQELAGLQNIDAAVREHLQQTLAEIETGLDELAADEGPLATHDAGLVHRLSDFTRHFEDEHADFAALLGSVINTLGRMGI